MLQFYNTLTKKKEQFTPLNKGEVRMYCCGPTVYNYAHIGNLRAYVFDDILRRYLIYKGFKVTEVMNLTDVDDKTIRDSQKEGKSLKEFTDFYIEEFLQDLKTLRIQTPEHMPRATEYITEIVKLIQQLEKHGHTYTKEGSIYYKISTFPHYGTLANLKLDELKENADGRLDADEYAKEDARDFALWKAYEDSDGDVFWETDIGKGRPGWHIECSAMSTQLLGDHFDIHCGGVDLVFPHHTNEIAQSEGATKKKFVNYWLHNEHLLVEGKKMSKSLGNFYTLRDLLKKSCKPLAVRYILLASQYRQQMNFTLEQVSAAESSIARLEETVDKLQHYHEGTVHPEKKDETEKLCKTVLEEFESAMDDDLNTPNALIALFQFVKQTNILIAENKLTKADADLLVDTIKKINDVFDIITIDNADSIPEEVTLLANQRLQAKKEKNFKFGDELRDKIKELGYQVDDTPQGYRIKKL